MALDFPNAPITGATFPGPNGALWQWDGEKWTAVSTSSTGGGGGASIVAQPSPPTLTANALWWDTIGGQLYVCYDDGVAPLQWVVASNIPGPPASQVTQVDVASAQRNVGRNLIHNALFTVAQRGAGPFSFNASNGYTADRWSCAAAGGDTMSVTPTGAQGDGVRAAVGDEEINSAFGNVFVGTSTAASMNNAVQRIENARRLAGKTIIVSFWAWASANGLKLGINLAQNFGSGGSPSATVLALATGAAVTLSTTWTRYSATIAVPSVAGKTFGTTAGTDFTALQFWYSSGATNAANAGNIGVQSGTISIWGVQLEIAAAGQTAPTPLEKMDAQQTLAVCQRFYQVGTVQLTANSTAGYSMGYCGQLRTSMRGTVTYAIFGTPTLTNCTAPAIAAFGPDNSTYQAIAQTTATAITAFIFNFSASADL